MNRNVTIQPIIERARWDLLSLAKRHSIEICASFSYRIDGPVRQACEEAYEAGQKSEQGRKKKTMHLFHKWTNWSEPELVTMTRKFADPSLKEFTCNRWEQKRKCEKCNLQQRREVKKIYESGTDFPG